jgi:hypothetical protein
MTEAESQACGRFLSYVDNPGQSPPQEVLSHIESCPSCLAVMISHQEASRDLFMEAKYNRELALARKLYEREHGAESSTPSSRSGG